MQISVKKKKQTMRQDKKFPEEVICTELLYLNFSKIEGELNPFLQLFFTLQKVASQHAE